MKRRIYIIVTLFMFFVGLSSSTVRPKIARIAEKLSKTESIHLGLPVGFSAIPETKNKHYKLFLKLQKLATDSELVALTKHKSTNVVIYSFIALTSRNYSGLKEILLEHLYDSSTVWISAGCTGSFDRVNTFMLNSLKPNQYQGSKNYLTEKEYQDYFKLINK